MAQDPISNFKANFHRNTELTLVNNAGVAPLSRPAHETLQYWSKRFYEEGIFAVMDAIEASNKTRASLARLLNARENEISFYTTTAVALSQMAFGIDLKADDEILVWDQEYPSNLYPWRDAAQRTGAKLVLAKSGESLSTPIESLLGAVTERTKVIAVSWVQYQTGAITDLKALSDFARPRGILTVVDVIQGVGLLPFDFKAMGVDAVCGGSHKWLVSPLSVGYLCLREELFAKVKPLTVGAMTYGTPDDAVDLSALPKPGPQRFEPGSKNFLDIAALGASIDLLLSTGVERVAQEVEWLSRKLSHGLRERGYIVHSPHGQHHRGSIVNFSPGTDAKFKTLAELDQALTHAKITFGRRKPGLRISPHAFNTEDDLNKILQTLGD